MLTLNEVGINRRLGITDLYFDGTEIYSDLYPKIINEIRPISQKTIAISKLKKLNLSDIINIISDKLNINISDYYQNDINEEFIKKIYKKKGIEYINKKKSIKINEYFSGNIKHIIKKELELDISDISEEEINEYFLYSFFEDLKIDFKNLSDISLTLHDLFNIPLESDEEIENLIYKKLGIDINGKIGIEAIQNIFNKSIDFYTNRYLKTVPASIGKIKFKNKNDIIKFIKKTKNDRKYGSIICSILKVGYSINDILENPKVNREGYLEEKFNEKYLNKFFSIIDKKEIGGITHKVCSFRFNDKDVYFNFISRQKSIDSITGKQIAYPKYFAIDEYKDLVGGTFYVNNKCDATLLLQYIDQVIFHGNGNIENKNAIKPEDIQELGVIEKNFLEKLLSSINRKKENKGKITPESYIEIKITGDVGLPLTEETEEENIGTEMKVVIDGQDNEKGLSLHAIYDYSKRFTELTRLGIPISQLDILNFINEFFDEIDVILYKKNKNKNIYLNELYIDLKQKGFIEDDSKLNGNESKNIKILGIGLYHYFINNLVEFKLPNSNRIYYADKRALNMINIGLFPKEIYSKKKK